MDGPLTGEIVTRVRFDGSEPGGAGTSSNFITRRLARLPLQFRINVRAPFYQLITSLRSLYDPAAVRDPRGLGLAVGRRDAVCCGGEVTAARRSRTGCRPGRSLCKFRPTRRDPDLGTIQDEESE